jgi:uncharacterized membrane protein
MRAIPKQSRVESIDLARGLAMVLMALDHVRLYLHFDSLIFSPTDLRRTTPAIFATRVATHFCAPTFILLAGVSAWLVARRKSAREASVFLFSRGAWLIFLQLTVVRFAWNFDPALHFNSSTILSTIGVCMLALAALIRLPMGALLGLSLAMIAGHNALDGISFPSGSAADVAWSFLHVNKLYALGGKRSFQFAYPVIPWVGVMALGYCLGSIFGEEWTSEQRKRLLLRAGAGALAAFAVLRAFNHYGDPVPWARQPTAAMTVVSFFNLEKYPPSLSYLCLTLGMALLVLGVSEGRDLSRARPLIEFGRVALFYYVVHLFVVHAVALIAALSAGYPLRSMVFTGTPARASPLLQGRFGLGLGGIYALWAGIVVALYPACAAWSVLKSRNRAAWWASYV